MAKRITVVISQGQSANPVKRDLEERLVAELLFERGIEVTVIPHLYDLSPAGTGMLCLQGVTGDMIVLSWLYPRASRWILARNNVKGREGVTLLQSDEEDDDDDETDNNEAAADANSDATTSAKIPNRSIYCLDLRAASDPKPFVDEIRRIIAESTVKTVDLAGWMTGSPKPAAVARASLPTADNLAIGPIAAFPAVESTSQPTAQVSDSAAPAPTLDDSAAAVVNRIEEAPARRWYPVIDYSRCTNCMECIDFCLFGVYGIDSADQILIEQPDNCRKGCPACSRVCPENAIMFPQHKTPAIAGSDSGAAGGLKIDLSKLFGAPDAVEVAAMERDVELVATGREAVGLTVGIPKRQTNKPAEPKDDLDALMDQLDDLDI